jgi:hypothetical protein
MVFWFKSSCNIRWWIYHLCIAKFYFDLGWSGRNCDNCLTNPCVHGGTCTGKYQGHTCTCLLGYTGDHCQTDIDECLSNPCYNNATCTDKVNSYTCSCPVGFTGSRCQTDINDCKSNTCNGRGSCKDLINGFTCTCNDGYSGKNCEVDINEWFESKYNLLCIYIYLTMLCVRYAACIHIIQNRSICHY